MQKKSLAQKRLDSNKPFVFYHTHHVTEDSLNKAIFENRSMDLDISIRADGSAYLGHSEEYYEKSGEKMVETIPLSRAIKLLSKSEIPIIVDCKNNGAWEIIKGVVRDLGEERCLVHTYVSQLKFSNTPIEIDPLVKWSDISKFVEIKQKYPFVTTVASAKGLPVDLSLGQHIDLLEEIRELLVRNAVDEVCLNVPNKQINNELMEFFIVEGVFPHVNVDKVSEEDLSVCYVGETDILENTSVTL